MCEKAYISPYQVLAFHSAGTRQVHGVRAINQPGSMHIHIPPGVDVEAREKIEGSNVEQLQKSKAFQLSCTMRRSDQAL